MSRIALIGDNSIEYIRKLLEIWNENNCAVIIDWRVPIESLVCMLKEANVKECFIDSKFMHKYKNLNIGDIQIHSYCSTMTSVPTYLPGDIYEKYIEKYSSDEALVIYSSGTTGKSKGVILTHYAINTNADSILDYLDLSNNDCIYTATNIAHASTLVGELLVALKTKIKLIIAPTIVPPRYTLRQISVSRATIICINPTLLKQYTEEYKNNPERYNLSTLREIYVHGAKNEYVHCVMAKQIFSNVNIYYEYGLTEAGPRVTSQKISSKSIDSVGKPIKGVRLVLIADDEIIEASNKKGVIHIYTPAKYKSYINGEEKHIPYQQGWLNTGDLGYWDDNGEIHIVGRIDDVINIDAHKIYPSDIESNLYKLSNIVSECCVIKYKKSEKEFLVCVYVAQNDIESDIRKRLSSVLMAYEIPKVFIKVDNMPKNSNGKVCRSNVAKIVGGYFDKSPEICMKKYANKNL